MIVVNVYENDAFQLASKTGLSCSPLVTEIFLTIAQAVKFITKHKGNTFGCYVYVMLVT